MKMVELKLLIETAIREAINVGELSVDEEGEITISVRKKPNTEVKQ